jgi:hypothetical protein
VKRVKDVIVLDEAADDLGDGIAFYDAQDQGVGRYFFDSVVADIDSLLLYAGIHSVRLGYHRMLATRFPFAIYYEIVDDVARVVAVLDMRRDPAWIRKELEERHG